MDNAKLFLLKKIAGYKNNGLPTLGHLDAKHIDDISLVMIEFFEESFKEIREHLNKGETIDVNGKVYSLKRLKSK